MKDIGDKVQVVIDGGRGLFSLLLKPSNICASDGKQARVAVQEARSVIERTANSIDEIKCLCFLTSSFFFATHT